MTDNEIKERKAAIEYLWEVKIEVNDGGECLIYSSWEIEEAIKALEKELPKTVVKDEYHHNCCPNCGWIVSYDEGWGEKYVPHCENCGQAIDWSKEE